MTFQKNMFLLDPWWILSQAMGLNQPTPNDALECPEGKDFRPMALHQKSASGEHGGENPAVSQFCKMISSQQMCKTNMKLENVPFGTKEIAKLQNDPTSDYELVWEHHHMEVCTFDENPPKNTLARLKRVSSTSKSQFKHHKTQDWVHFWGCGIMASQNFHNCFSRFKRRCRRSNTLNPRSM